MKGSLLFYFLLQKCHVQKFTFENVDKISRQKIFENKKDQNIYKNVYQTKGSENIDKLNLIFKKNSNKDKSEFRRIFPVHVRFKSSKSKTWVSILRCNLINKPQKLTENTV